MGLVYVLYWLAVAGLFVYGVNCYVLTRAFVRHRQRGLADLARRRAAHTRRFDARGWPKVTVQLPVYNERYVVGRLIHAVTRLDYPRDRLEIQVLDDSTDDTSALVAELVGAARAEGFQIEHHRRRSRDGFKAGALAAGLARAGGELIAIFDADFVPHPDFLRRAVPFFAEPAIGLVQARWGHVNAGHSPLTRVQSLAIDGHFGVEQAGRRWGGFLLNFNGTAGVWRRTAIEEAGGWQHDTLTEDLDLSYRAQLCGWKIEYLLDTEVPAEIPVELSAFKAQQRRWAKGSIQTAKKLLPRVLRAELPARVKLQAAVHLTHYLVHPLMLLVALLAVPLLRAWDGAAAPLPFALMVLLIAAATAGPSTLYVVSQRALRGDARRRILWLPALMALGTGLAVSNSRAVLEALAGIRSPFVRTPKRGVTGRDPGGAPGRYRLPFDPMPLVEAVAALWAGYGLFLYLRAGKLLIGPYLMLYAAGFGAVAIAGAAEMWRRRQAGEEETERCALPAAACAERDYARALAAARHDDANGWTAPPTGGRPARDGVSP